MSFRKSLIVHPALSDAATLTGPAAESSGTVLTNVQLQRARERYVTEALPNVQIKVNLVDAGFETVEWDFIGLLYTNLGAADTMDLASATTEGGLATPAWTETGVVPAAGRRGREWVHAFHFLGDGNERTDAWIQIDLTVADPILPAGYGGADFLQIGRLVVGKAWRPLFHVEQGYQYLQSLEDDLVVESFDGEQIRFRRGAKRGHRFTVGWMEEAESLDFADAIDWRRGTANDVLAILDPDSARVDQMIYHGTIRSSPIQQGVGGRGSDMHSKTYEIVQEVAD